MNGKEIDVSSAVGVIGGLNLELAYFFHFFDWMGLLAEVGVMGHPIGFVQEGDDQYSLTTPPLFYMGIGVVTGL